MRCGKQEDLNNVGRASPEPFAMLTHLCPMARVMLKVPQRLQVCVINWVGIYTRAERVDREGG